MWKSRRSNSFNDHFVTQSLNLLRQQLLTQIHSEGFFYQLVVVLDSSFRDLRKKYIYSIMQTGMRTHYSPQRETIEGVFSTDQPPVLADQAQ